MVLTRRMTKTGDSNLRIDEDNNNEHDETAQTSIRTVSSLQRASLKPLHQFYIDISAKFKSPLCYTLSIVLETESTHLELPNSFSVQHMLALGAVLKRDSTIKSIDFSRTCITSAGCYVIREILESNSTLKIINLPYNRIDDFGAKELAMGMEKNTSVEAINLRGNLIHSEGALALAQALSVNKTIVHIDLSYNTIRLASVNAVKQVLKLRAENRHLFDPLDVRLEGVHLLAEITNSITHGLGVVLAILGGWYLLSVKTQNNYEMIACGTYILSLLAMFISSTLNHSFFLMEQTSYIFNLLDHASIYTLIAGTYTPFMVINLKDSWIGMVVLICVWALAIMGCAVDLIGGLRYKRLSLGLYFLIGWFVIVAWPQLSVYMQPVGLYLICAGGLVYTAGVYFFIAGNTFPMYHAIWHIFVLVASALHYFAVLYYALAPPAIE